MNHSISIIASLGTGIMIGVLLEKKFNFKIGANKGYSTKGNSKQRSKSTGTLYNKSGKYQDQSKSGKGKGLTKESKTGNIE